MKCGGLDRVASSLWCRALLYLRHRVAVDPAVERLENHDATPDDGDEEERRGVEAEPGKVQGYVVAEVVAYLLDRLVEPRPRDGVLVRGVHVRPKGVLLLDLGRATVDQLRLVLRVKADEVRLEQQHEVPPLRPAGHPQLSTTTSALGKPWTQAQPCEPAQKQRPLFSLLLSSLLLSAPLDRAAEAALGAER